jgi:hypothetical protein
MESSSTRTVYCSDVATLYEYTFISMCGTKRPFYCLVVGQERHYLSKEEGFILEKSVAESFNHLHIEGIEINLVNYSSFLVTDKLH